MNADTGAVRKLTARYGGYAWSPDGRRLARVYGYDPLVLETVDPDGGDQRVVVRLRDTLSWGPVAWSPDGRALAFIRCTTSEISAGSLATIEADGTGLRTVARVSSFSKIGSPESFPPGPSWVGGTNQAPRRSD